MSTKQAKTNTINTKSSYFILDGFIYETDLKTITRKEKLADCLDLPELKNKLLYPAILKQLQLYINDGFKIASIKETAENFTTRTIKIENKKEKIIYKDELLKVIKINLKNNAGGSSCLTAKYEPIPETLLNFINRPELAKSINLIKATCFMSKYADLRNYGKTINKKAISTKYIFLANIYGLDFYVGNDFKINDYGDKKSGSLSLFCEVANNFYYLTSNLGNEAENKKAIENLGKQEIIDFLKKHYDLEIEQNQFNFIHFAIYYLIASLEQDKKEISRLEKKIEKKEQEKQSEKPCQNLLPALYTPEQKTPIRINSKVQPVIKKSLGNIDGIYSQSTYIRFKTFDSAYKLKRFLDSIPTINKSMENVAETYCTGCIFFIPAWVEIDKKEFAYFSYQGNEYRYDFIIQQNTTYLLAEPKRVLQLPAPAEQIELADYTEIAEIHKEATLGNHGGLDNFYELYTAKLREKRAIRKANSKIAMLFNRIMQFSAAAVLCFLFVNTYLNIEKSNSVMDSMAKIETANPTAVNMADLSDCGSGGIIQHGDKEPVKTMPFEGLKWISLVGLFGITRRKTKKEYKKHTDFTSVYSYEILSSRSNRKFIDLYLYGQPRKSLKQLRRFIAGDNR